MDQWIHPTYPRQSDDYRPDSRRCSHHWQCGDRGLTLARLPITAFPHLVLTHFCASKSGQETDVPRASCSSTPFVTITQNPVQLGLVGVGVGINDRLVHEERGTKWCANGFECQRCLLEIETIGEVVRIRIRITQRRKIVDLFQKVQNTSKVMIDVRDVACSRVS